MVDTPSSVDDAADTTGSSSDDSGADTSNGVDIAAIMQSFGKVNASIDQSMANLNATVGQAKSATAKEMNARTQIAKYTADVNLITATAASKELADNRAAAAYIGTDPNAPSFLLSKLATRSNDELADLQSRSDAIQKKEDLSFWDDPLSWISNQITLPMDVAAYNNKLQQKAVDDDAFHELVNKTLDAAKVNNVIDAVDQAKKVNALNKIELLKSVIDNAQSQEQLAKFGVQVIDVRQKLSNEQFTNLMSVNEALNARLRMEQSQQELALTKKRIEQTDQEIQLRQQEFQDNKIMRQQEFDLSKERFGLDEKRYQHDLDVYNNVTLPNAELTQLQKTILNDQRNENLQAQQAFQSKLDQATSMLGLNKITVAQYKMLNPSTRAALDQFVLAGYSGLGYNTAAALDNANSMNAPLNPGMNIIRKKLVDIRNKVVAEYNQSQGLKTGVTFEKLKPGEKNVAEEIGIEKAVKSEYLSIPDEGGVYSPAPLSHVLNIQSIDDLPLVKELQPLAASSPILPTRAQDIFTTAAKMVADGKATPAQAAQQISKIYNAINLDNTATRQYRTFKLEAPTKFRTTLYTGVGWSGSTIVDMTNPVQLQALLTRKAVVSATGQLAQAPKKAVPDAVNPNAGQ